MEIAGHCVVRGCSSNRAGGMMHRELTSLMITAKMIVAADAKLFLQSARSEVKRMLYPCKTTSSIRMNSN